MTGATGVWLVFLARGGVRSLVGHSPCENARYGRFHGRFNSSLFALLRGLSIAPTLVLQQPVACCLSIHKAHGIGQAQVHITVRIWRSATSAQRVSNQIIRHYKNKRSKEYRCIPDIEHNSNYLPKRVSSIRNNLRRKITRKLSVKYNGAPLTHHKTRKRKLGHDIFHQCTCSVRRINTLLAMGSAIGRAAPHRDTDQGTPPVMCVSPLLPKIFPVSHSPAAGSGICSSAPPLTSQCGFHADRCANILCQKTPDSSENTGSHTVQYRK